LVETPDQRARAHGGVYAPGFRDNTSMIAKQPTPEGHISTCDDGHGNVFKEQRFNVITKPYAPVQGVSSDRQTMNAVYPGAGPKRNEPQDFGSGDASSSMQPADHNVPNYPPGPRKEEPTPKPVRT
jgi:hypothetical protein